MNFKDILAKMSQLSEATEKTKTGLKNKGSYGSDYETDVEGNEKKKDTSGEKKGRGRPKKDDNEEGKKFDTKTVGDAFGAGKKPSKEVGTVSKKNTLKDWFDRLDSALNEGEVTKTNTGLKHKGSYGSDYETDDDGNEKNTEKKGRGRPAKDADDKKFDTSNLNKAMSGKLKEAEQIQIKPASQMPKQPGQTSLSTKPAVPGQPQQMSGQAAQNTQVIAQGNKTLGTVNNPQLAQQIKQSIGKGEMTLMPEEEMAEGKDEGKPGKNFAKIAKSAGAHYGSKAAGERVAGAVRAKLMKQGKIKEAEMPTHDGDKGAGLGAGRSQGMLEGKAKPDFLDMDKDGNKKESMKKAVKDKNKDKLDEGIMDKLKGLMVPKLIKLLGPDAEKIANAVRQASGGNLTPSKENAIKVAKALGIDKAVAQSQSVAEGIAGNWQGKLIQALYTLGLVGAAAGSASIWTTTGGSWLSVVGMLLLMFASVFFGDAPGQYGTMGNFGNKGTETNRGLDDHGMPIRMQENKQKVKESMDNRLKAAHHAGRSHGLTAHAHCGKNYDDMEEARMYHEGYKQGLDECHGQMPIQGYVGENDAEVDDMASFGAHTPSLDEDEFEEGNAFTGKLATTPAGGSFSLGGKSFKDTSSYDSSVFESWDKQLGALLLAEYNTIQEGLTVSISKGQEGSPDSVSVNAQDGEADQLLQFIKQAGLGIFGGEEQAQVGPSSPMSQATDGEPSEIGVGGEEIGVVGDHDGMMDLIRKVTGGQEQSGPEHGFSDSEESEEGHDHGEEECNECGMMECGCGPDDEGKEKVDEVESEDQQEYEVAEDNAPDSGAEDTELENNDDQEANQSASSYDEAEDEEKVEEGYANGADDTFESDIDFMTRVISGGLNKQKSTGQTTTPVIASQGTRQVSESKMLNESVNDWKKLAGIK